MFFFLERLVNNNSNKLAVDLLGSVVQRTDNATQRINRYPAVKCVNKTHCTIHWIEIYPVDSVNRNFEQLSKYKRTTFAENN